MEIPPPPPGFRQHQTWPELAANEAGQAMRWNLCPRPPRWKCVAGHLGTHGYLALSLPRCTGSVLVHRIVFECFNGTRKWSTKSGSGMTINHINGVKHDNRLCNLEAITNAENTRNFACKSGLPRFLSWRGKRIRIQAYVSGVHHQGPTFSDIRSAELAIPGFLASIGHDAATQKASP